MAAHRGLSQEFLLKLYLPLCSDSEVGCLSICPRKQTDTQTNRVKAYVHQHCVHSSLLHYSLSTAIPRVLQHISISASDAGVLLSPEEGLKTIMLSDSPESSRLLTKQFCVLRSSSDIVEMETTLAVWCGEFCS